MISEIKVKDVIDNFRREEFEIVKKYEVVDAMWGIELIKITNKDIEALKMANIFTLMTGSMLKLFVMKNRKARIRNEL